MPPRASQALARGVRGLVFAVAQGQTSRKVGQAIFDQEAARGDAWRRGVADIAIGAAGMPALADLRGQHDAQGVELQATIIAHADEIAAAADLVRGKTGGRPVAVVRGLRVTHPEDGPGAQVAIRPPEEDMFRTGT